MRDDNFMLTQTASDTPVGRLFRHFWLPALLSSELPRPDCPPVRVRILGENLVAFRDSDNRVGLLDAHCPHRRAELYYGRNEQGGLRCIYHGWKFDVNGSCVDIPTEENGCELAKSRPVAAYPVIEQGGVVWVWMGPPERQPAPPEFDFCTLPLSHVYISKCLMKCNYLQALEGSIDYSHISFLHKESAGGADVFGIGELIRFANDDGKPTISTTPTAYGMRIAARRNAGDDAYFWRIARWLAPAFVVVPTEVGNVCRANAFIPIDDENCWWYRIRYHAGRPLSNDELAEYKGGGLDYAKLVSGTYIPEGNRANDYLMDRTLQKSGSFTGVLSAQLQDLVVQESQGAIADRTKEHLGSSDTAIVKCRRRLIESAKKFATEGTIPAAVSRADLYKRRAVAMLLPKEMTAEQAGTHPATVPSA